jgi:hypothetical protein
MEALTQAFANLKVDTNYKIATTNYYFQPSVPQNPNPMALFQHTRTVSHAMHKFCYPHTIEEVIHRTSRSTLTPEAIIYDFMKGDIPRHFIIRDDTYQKALDITTERFRPDTPCRPAHLLDVEHHYPLKLSTNAEPPFSTDPFFTNMIPHDEKKTTGNMKNIIFDFTRRWHHEIKNGAHFDTHMYPMQLHLKASLFNIDQPNKLRTVWGVPKPWILAQIMFHWSLFANYRRNPTRYPLLWGYETSTGGHFRLNHELFLSHLFSTFLMLDWTSFDKYVPHEGISDVHSITRTYIDFDHGYLPTRDYPDTQSTWTNDKANRLHRLYNWTLHLYKNSLIILPDGTAIKRQFCTLPSGLYTTQYYDSAWNHIMISAVLLELGFDPTKCIIKILGDDSIIKIFVCIPPSYHQAFLEKFAEIALRRFGSRLSIEKSSIKNNVQNIEVLSYRNNNGLPERTDVSLLAKLYHTTSRNPTPSITMATAVGIAFASYGQHRNVFNVCKDIYDHYARLGVTPDPKGIKHGFYLDPNYQEDIPLDNFPSLSDLRANLLNLEHVNTKTYNRFFPRSHFLSDF